ncbi:MAG: T9SS type B sorting domain-containing protein, partial [Bacteroidales bacterium]
SSPQTATIIATPSFTNNGVTCTGSSDTFLITVNPIPDISATADQTLCHNTQTTAINFTSSVTNTVFNWTNDNTTIGLAASGSGNISSFTATNTGSSPQTATIIATPSFTNNGVTCTGSSDTFLITVNPIPDIASVSDQSLCANLLTTPINFVSTVNNTLFSWINDNPSIGLPSSGSGNIPSFTVINESLELQTATIIVTPSFTNNGVTCTGVSETFLINVYPLTIAGFSVLPNHTSEDDGLVNIIDYSIGATSWYYDFGVEDDVNDIFTEREPIYRYNYEGNYTIMQIVNNQYNCPDTAYNDVIVKPSIIFYIPNAFTPNEDDKNEFFMPYGFNVSPLEYEFRIYDRWGKQLFYTTDINQGWDGKYKGEYVKQDMYVYMVKVRLEDGPQVFRGSVYLLK